MSSLNFNPYRLIAAPQTWGELKKVISCFPENSQIAWINQPRQSIYEREPYDDDTERVIGFQ